LIKRDVDLFGKILIKCPWYFSGNANEWNVNSDANFNNNVYNFRWVCNFLIIINIMTI